jgi:threonine/homoserine/homoserine lactone efflux protein
VVLFFITFLPQFVDRADPHAVGKLFFLGCEQIVIGIPFAILTVLAAAWIARTLTRTRWVQRALNWSFAGVFTTFAGVILTAQARH